MFPLSRVSHNALHSRAQGIQRWLDWIPACEDVAQPPIFQNHLFSIFFSIAYSAIGRRGWKNFQVAVLEHHKTI